MISAVKNIKISKYMHSLSIIILGSFKLLCQQAKIIMHVLILMSQITVTYKILSSFKPLNDVSAIHCNLL